MTPGWPADSLPPTEFSLVSGEVFLIGTELVINCQTTNNTTPQRVRVLVTGYDPSTRTATLQALGYMVERITGAASNGYEGYALTKHRAIDALRQLSTSLDEFEKVCRVFLHPPWHGTSYQRAVPCLGAACKPPVFRGLSRRRFGRCGMSLAQRSRHKRRMWVQHLREVS